MIHPKLFINIVSKGIPPGDWFCEYHINVQRIYYIKSGSGFAINKVGEWERLIPGNLYVFPYNYSQYFRSDKNDMINHIYIDFMSYPPINANEALVYKVDEGSRLSSMIKLLDSVLEERPPEITKGYPLYFGLIDNADSGSFEEYKQMLYHLIEALLVMLSHETVIPFSTDELVNSTVDYIHNNYTEHISIDELARRHYISTNCFIARFRKIMGCTPYQYLKNYRLYQASILIKHGVSVSEAASKIGYRLASSLSREIHKFDELK